MNVKKKKKWLRARHMVVRRLLYAPFSAFTKWRYGVTIDRFPADPDRQYLILLNHTTAFDQFFVDLSFRRRIYYLATEDIFSKGWVSSLIRWLVAPIPIRKQTTDVQAVMTCIRVAQEGGTLCIAPEGNRTYSGRTEYMNPAIAPLVKKLRLPLALYRIEGGYGVQPRWSDCIRRGRMHAYVSQVIEPEEYADMTNEELMDRIRTGLHVDEAVADGEYRHRKLAEYIERAIYVCPDCGLSTFHSRDDLLRCETCGKTVRYLPTKELEGVDCDFPFRFLRDWYDYQTDFVNTFDLTAHCETPLYEEHADLSEVIVYKKKLLLEKNARIRLYGDRVELGGTTYPYAEISAVTVLGRNKCNFYIGKQIFQLKGNPHFNALKYVQLYYRHKNMTTGDGNGKFLGI